MLRRLVLAALALWALPAAAAQADVRVESGVVRAAPDAGGRLIATVSQAGPGADVTFSAHQGLTAGPGCTAAAGEIRCPGALRVEVVSAGGPDALTVGSLAVPLDWRGGEAFDALAAGGVGLRISLDGVANDAFGAGPPQSNVHPDVEDVRGGSAGDVVIGSSGPNDLAGGDGPDTLIGGGGYDTIDGGPGDDEIDARDGLPELVDCGAGADDRATLDAVDEPVGCETVVADGTLPPDLDGDGVRPPTDCDDTNAAVRPGAAEIADNGWDDDCAGGDAIGLDRDGDGVPRPDDCDDTMAAVHPGAPELPGNGRDDDCDGVKAPFPRIGVTLSQATGASGSGTRFLRLRLNQLRRGDAVLVTCGGRGCPLRRRTLHADRARLNLRRLFGARRIKRAGRVTIKVTDDRGVSKQFAFEMRRAEAPIFVIRCSSPPDFRLRRC